MTASLGLVIPLFNEERRVPEFGKLLVEFITDQPPGSELLFVDDGSTDGTVAVVEELLAASPDSPVRLLRRPHEGKGAAVAAGLAQVSGSYGGFCDVDLATPLDQVQRVLNWAMRAEVLAIGSRDLATSRLLRPEGPVRETLGRAYNRLLQATVTPGVVDTQCGAKAASRHVWQTILPHCREQGFAWDAEAVAVARVLGIPVQEVPVEWRHDERSGVRVVRDGAAMVRATPRIWRNARRVAMTNAGKAPADEVFDSANAELLMTNDRDHWWFRSKAALVATALRRTGADRDQRAWLIDAGAGSGGVTAMLGWALDRVVVAEGNAALVGQAHREHGLSGVQAGVDHLPLADRSAEVVCLLDVIEHVADPGPTLNEAARVLVSGGRLVVNVPAHQWLWSAADEFLGHVRRYTRPALRQELAAAGFQPVILTHVFSWLVPPVWLKRKVATGGGAELGLDQTSLVVDRVAMVLTRLERGLVGRVSLPFGTSVLCIAERVHAQSSSPLESMSPLRGLRPSAERYEFISRPAS